VTVLLHDGPVDSPRSAVRAFIEVERSL